MNKKYLVFHVGEIHSPEQSDNVDIGHPPMCWYKEEIDGLYNVCVLYIQKQLDTQSTFTLQLKF